MDQAQITQSTEDLEALFESVMKLYYLYLDALEKAIVAVPESEIEILVELNELLKEVEEAMEHDVGIFEQAIESDVEEAHHIGDKLKINEIRNQLMKK